VRFRLNGAKKPTVESLVLRGAHRIVVSDSLWISNSNFDLPLTFSEYDFKNWPNAVNASKKISAVVGDVDQLVHNIYRYIEYPSFDQKKVSTFLSIPKKEVRGAIIVSFYGGTNQYSWLNQLFAELGFIVMSPAVRGSWSKSSEWRDLIKGDLGGNEILDLHWAAKYLEKEFGFTPSQIGVYGGSHGGYAVLRALTMPKGFNGLAESAYPYGFGLCWAGFADLEDFYKTSNIPDWLVGMLGPYEGNEKKYRERSPLHDFENLKAPLFISHGTNDARVSPTSMDGFIEKLKHSKKNYVLHMMSGLGHGGGSKAEELEEYSKMVRFLKELPKPAKQG
jgi:dipeptidyl aminopeptidase/acylaminoacyl peptidase